MVPFFQNLAQLHYPSKTAGSDDQREKMQLTPYQPSEEKEIIIVFKLFKII